MMMDNNLLNTVYQHFLASTGVSIDTRTLQKGQLFFAIVGDNFDGNDYAIAALEMGAYKSIVSDKSINHEDCIYVEDTLKCLQQLATHRRIQRRMNILALTGSNGKTTTKELIAQVLKSKYRIDYTKGNLNNHLGVPLTLLSFRPDLEIGIVEMGANHLREIDTLSKIALPDFGLITNIGRAHIGEFGGQSNILVAKTELYRDIISREGMIFCNDTVEVLFEQVNGYSNVVYFGSSYQGGVELIAHQSEPFLQLEIKNAYNSYSFVMNLGGSHNFSNVQVAVAVGLFFGLSPKAIADQLSLFESIDNRSQWVDTSRNKVFLDAYNANPDSVKAAIKYFSDLHETDSKLVLIGDMKELGEYSDKEHREIFRMLDQSGMRFYLIGPEFAASVKDSRVFESKDHFERTISLNEIKETTILIKGSRGMKLESLLEKL